MNYINNQSSDQKYAIDTLAEIKNKNIKLLRCAWYIFFNLKNIHSIVLHNR